MTFLPYNDLLILFDVIANFFREEGEFAVVDREDGRHGPMKLTAFTNPDAFVLVRFTRPDDPTDWVCIQIAGGGGLGARPESGLFQHLIMRSGTFEWGGPFATQKDDGTVSYGSHLTIPSSLINNEDPSDARDYIINMIRVIGQMGRILANEALPYVGGTLLDGSDPRHVIELFAAALGPAPDWFIEEHRRPGN